MPVVTEPSPHKPPEQNPRFVDRDATESERTHATLTHLTFFAPFLIVPIVVIALIMWKKRRHESPFLDDHGREAVNFQISLVIYWAAASVLSPLGVGIVLLPIISGLGVVGTVMAAMAANRGEFFRYPACLRVLT